MTTTTETLHPSPRHWIADLADDDFVLEILEHAKLGDLTRAGHWEQLGNCSLSDLIGTASAR